MKAWIETTEYCPMYKLVLDQPEFNSREVSDEFVERYKRAMEEVEAVQEIMEDIAMRGKR